MKALILAAGRGSRLMPLTKKVPKCLMPINRKPLLEIWLEKLSKLGVKEFLINTHYLSNVVNEYVNTSKFRKQITLVYEKELLGTAGTLKNNIQFFNNENDAFFLHGDNYTNDNLMEFYLCHNSRPKKCLMTMMTFETDKPQEAGIVNCKNGVLQNYFEKHKEIRNGNIANGAIYILGKEFISSINEDFPHSFDFSSDIIPKLLGKVFTYKTKYNFIDIGTPINYQKVK